MTHERAQDAGHLYLAPGQFFGGSGGGRDHGQLCVADTGALSDRLLTQHVLPALQR